MAQTLHRTTARHSLIGGQTNMRCRRGCQRPDHNPCETVERAECRPKQLALERVQDGLCQAWEWLVNPCVSYRNWQQEGSFAGVFQNIAFVIAGVWAMAAVGYVLCTALLYLAVVLPWLQQTCLYITIAFSYVFQTCVFGVIRHFWFIPAALCRVSYDLTAFTVTCTKAVVQTLLYWVGQLVFPLCELAINATLKHLGPITIAVIVLVMLRAMHQYLLECNNTVPQPDPVSQAHQAVVPQRRRDPVSQAAHPRQAVLQRRRKNNLRKHNLPRRLFVDETSVCGVCYEPTIPRTALRQFPWQASVLDKAVQLHALGITSLECGHCVHATCLSEMEQHMPKPRCPGGCSEDPQPLVFQ
eukprot:m.50707 g.50707  ORF g.50707 m.50707 type:complete len:356 (+) comp11173_c0_seq2:146-1213(+)